MTREEAINHFRRTDGKEIIERAGKALFESINRHRESIEETLLESYNQIIDLWEEKGRPFPVSEIHFSYLRITVLDGTYLWQTEIKGPKRDLDEGHLECMMDMSEYFSVLEKYREELYLEAQKYVMKLTKSDCDQMIQELFVSKIGYLYMIGVQAFEKICFDEKLQNLEKYKRFHITMGERRGEDFILYGELKKQKSQEEVIKELTTQCQENDLTKRDYMMYQFQKLQLKEVRIMGKNLQFIRATDSEWISVEFVMNQMMLVDLSGTVIRDSAFHFCVFGGSNFSNCYLHHVTFAGSHFGIVPYDPEIQKHLSFIPTRFVNSRLYEVSFAGALLQGCDFTGAMMENVEFTEAEMEGVVMERKYQKLLSLSGEQMEAITWID